MSILHVCGRQGKYCVEFHFEVDPDLVIENLPNYKGSSSTGPANEATCGTFFQGYLEQISLKDLLSLCVRLWISPRDPVSHTSNPWLSLESVQVWEGNVCQAAVISEGLGCCIRLCVGLALVWRRSVAIIGTSEIPSDMVFKQKCCMQR